MVYFTSSDEWQRQSSLLLQARPTTTRITTKYNIPNLAAPKYTSSLKRKRTADAEKDAAAPLVPRATLVLKTYDPESGVVLKFKTDRAAEVGRLINGLGRVGRDMAALPPLESGQDIPVEDATTVNDDQAPLSSAPAALPKDASNAAAANPEAKGQAGGGAGGSKKKKKNKK